ncbi:histidine kinase [Bacterioplanes sanyensis]|uniref:response regulator n=1 Tax=Bacterioplanes sanyensis TaxID=1249553 RepID=UPI001673FA99|nr:response regulator [Bacterioplanes sanyensis]GGY48347.1 histidine kinase [Bacterioplanes sanyensis]
MSIRQWSIRRRITLVGAIPALITVVILTALNLWQRWNDIREDSARQAEILMANLTAAAEYPLISGNYDLLRPLISQILQQPAFVSLQLQAPTGATLLETFSDDYASLESQAVRYQAYPVTRLVEPLSDSELSDLAAEPATEETLAVIILGVSDHFIRQQQLQSLYQTLVSGVLVVVLAAVFGRLAAMGIIPPLENVSRFISRLALGNISGRIAVDHGAEIGQLQESANRLAESLEQAGKDQRAFTRQLMSEQQKTQAASRAKSEFLAMMSHELRTPLNGAVGMLQLLSLENSEQEFTEFKGLAEQSLTHLTQLLEDVLVVVDIEKNRLSVHPEAQRIPVLLENLLLSFRQRALENGLSLVVDYEPAVQRSWLRVDPSLLRQTVRHLVDNALKFTEQGMVVLHLALDQSLTPAQLRIAVTDTGIGIADEQKTRVLEAFAQVSSSFNRRYEGAGLGLTICHHISQILEGELHIEDNAGHGTRVTVILPVDMVESESSQPASTSSEPLRLLVVEDNAVNLKVTRKMLSRILPAAAIEAAEDGNECLEMCQQQSFDLVLLDCHMPGLDGFETSRALRKNGHTMPIIACTASTTDNIHERCLQAGMSDYLPKPLRVATLTATLQRWLPQP